MNIVKNLVIEIVDLVYEKKIAGSREKYSLKELGCCKLSCLYVFEIIICM